MIWEWLNSLGTGGAALLGALIGALATYGVRRFEEFLRRRRELRGLLRFLNLETQLNEELINDYTENPGLAGEPGNRRLSTRAWDAASIRLAQLLRDKELLQDLAEYYEEIRALEAYAQIPEDTVTLAAKVGELDNWLPRVIALNNRVRGRLIKKAG